MAHWYLFCLYSVGAYIGRYRSEVGDPDTPLPCDIQADYHFKQAIQLFNPVAIYFNVLNVKSGNPVHTLRLWGPFGNTEKIKECTWLMTPDEKKGTCVLSHFVKRMDDNKTADDKAFYIHLIMAKLSLDGSFANYTVQKTSGDFFYFMAQIKIYTFTEARKKELARFEIEFLKRIDLIRDGNQQQLADIALAKKYYLVLAENADSFTAYMCLAELLIDARRNGYIDWQRATGFSLRAILLQTPLNTQQNTQQKQTVMNFLEKARKCASDQGLLNYLLGHEWLLNLNNQNYLKTLDQQLMLPVDNNLDNQPAENTENKIYINQCQHPKACLELAKIYKKGGAGITNYPKMVALCERIFAINKEGGLEELGLNADNANYLTNLADEALRLLVDFVVANDAATALKGPVEKALTILKENRSLTQLLANPYWNQTFKNIYFRRFPDLKEKKEDSKVTEKALSQPANASSQATTVTAATISTQFTLTTTTTQATSAAVNSSSFQAASTTHLASSSTLFSQSYGVKEAIEDFLTSPDPTRQTKSINFLADNYFSYPDHQGCYQHGKALLFNALAMVLATQAFDQAKYAQRLVDIKERVEGSVYYKIASLFHKKSDDDKNSLLAIATFYQESLETKFNELKEKTSRPFDLLQLFLMACEDKMQEEKKNPPAVNRSPHSTLPAGYGAPVLITAEKFLRARETLLSIYKEYYDESQAEANFDVTHNAATKELEKIRAANPTPATSTNVVPMQALDSRDSVAGKNLL